MIELEYYIMGIILIPGIILALYAEIKVTTNFHKYSSVISQSGKTASEMARMFLDFAGLKDIKIIHVKGELTDYYNHREKVIALSDNVYNSSSISALGVACHEIGHALQYKTNYLPIKIRNFIIPICNFANNMLWVLIILGAIFFYTPLGMIFWWIGVGTFALAVLVNLITLPVEYNASNRALKLLEKSGVLNEEETECAKKVLYSAGLTYVASLVISILNLLRLVLVLLRHKDD